MFWDYTVVCCNRPNACSTHLHHLLRLNIDNQQSAQEGLGHVDVLIPDVDCWGPHAVLRWHPLTFRAHLLLGWTERMMGGGRKKQEEGKVGRVSWCITDHQYDAFYSYCDDIVSIYKILISDLFCKAKQTVIKKTTKLFRFLFNIILFAVIIAALCFSCIGFGAANTTFYYWFNC